MSLLSSRYTEAEKIPEIRYISPELQNEIALMADVMSSYSADRRFNKIHYYEPNEAQREFHRDGKNFRERLASWANRMGKTWGAGAEIYYHMSGEYPDWWEGYRYDRATRWWILGVSYKAIRGSSQRILFDENETGELGTGVIPLDVVNDPRTVIKFCKDDPDCMDYFRIPHVSGEMSYCRFITQQLDWTAVMGSEMDGCWADEQMQATKFYGQFQRATANTQGLIILTATPEKGRTEIFDRFEDPRYSNLCKLQYGNLYQATQYTPELISKMIAGYSEEEVPFRVWGMPVQGTGRVYKVDISKVRLNPDNHPVIKKGIPLSWCRIAGIDYGRVLSKTAVTWICYDPHAEPRIYYVYDHFWVRDKNPDEIAPKILLRDREVDRTGVYHIPCASPKDGNQAERSTGNRVAQMYKNLGVNMIEEAYNLVGIDGKKSFSVEAGVDEIEMLMNAGRFFILDTPNNAPLFEELSRYFRDEDGNISKKFDPHGLDAMRYGHGMADRYAESPRAAFQYQQYEEADTSWEPWRQIA